jgi:ATP-dependent Lon protease
VGLAWTSVGGEILVVEASKMEGDGELVLTGHLGDVMKESARLALNWVRTSARQVRHTIASTVQFAPQHNFQHCTVCSSSYPTFFR